MSHLTMTLAAAALSVLCGCTSVSGLDDKVFDLADAGDGQAGSGGSAGTGGSAGAGGDGGDGGGGGGCTDPILVFSDTTYDIVVPAGVSWLHAKAWGGGGNDECDDPDAGSIGIGGVGGFTEAVFQVTPGDPLSVIVGKRKFPGALTLEEQQEMGFPGEAAGGLSGVFQGAEVVLAAHFARALIIAGGGGGAGNDQGNCDHGGTGNATDSGGQDGTMLGADGTAPYNSGGGGYEGGNRGAAANNGGRGGQGWVDDSARTPKPDPVSEPEGSHAPPGTGDEDWSYPAGTPQAPGRVVLRFYCSEPPPL